jgi:signal peptidase I
MGEPPYSRRPTAFVPASWLGVHSGRRERPLEPGARSQWPPASILVAVKASNRLPQPWHTIADWVVTIVLAVVFVLAFEAEVAKPYRIPSSSMEPTLHCAKPGAWCEGSYNDRVIANRLAFRFSDPKRGQIIVFRTPPKAGQCGAGDAGATFVKRLIGLPGDVVSERDGQVYVNGAQLSEPYVDPAFRDNETASWPRVAPGHYFFLGDDRAHSCDSRTWGTVPRSKLIGPVLVTYWPPNRIDWFG